MRVLAIALQTLLFGLARAPALAAPFDPFSVICHSAACDHCCLCGATPTPAMLDAQTAWRIGPPPHRALAQSTVAVPEIVVDAPGALTHPCSD